MTVHHATHKPAAHHHRHHTNVTGGTAAPAPAKTPNAPAKPHEAQRNHFTDGFQPATGHGNSVAQYEYNLRGLTPDALDKREKWLEARIKDAGSGPSSDKQIVDRAKQQLALVKKEMADRKKLGHSVAGKDHRLDSADLKKELARQQEILKEATTGVDRDPKKAAAAKKAIAAAQHELKTRDQEQAAGKKLPTRTETKLITKEKLDGLKNKARTENGKDLRAELKKLRATEKDASHGAFQNDVQAKNTRSEIRAIRNELKLRGELAKQPDGKFALGIHKAPDAKVLDARAKWAERLNDATTGVARDPKAAKEAKQHLATIDAELARRGVKTKEPAAPAEPTGTVEQTPVADPAVGGTDAAANDVPATNDIPADDSDLPPANPSIDDLPADDVIVS